MTIDSSLEQNRETVKAFIDLAFNEKRVEEAVSRYIGSTYIQHNPMIPDGVGGLTSFADAMWAQFPQVHSEIKRVIAEGDLVVVHSKVTYSPEDRGSAAIDIFRLKDGRIVEHWDILQPIPETAANSNTMF